MWSGAQVGHRVANDAISWSERRCHHQRSTPVQQPQGVEQSAEHGSDEGHAQFQQAAIEEDECFEIENWAVDIDRRPILAADDGDWCVRCPLPHLKPLIAAINLVLHRGPTASELEH